jgi:hypothetical protein
MALELSDLGIEMYRARLRRENPTMSDDELERAVTEWLHHRPGAEHGDGVGRVATWPRRR